jgi:CDP-paratose 2-epimerase
MTDTILITGGAGFIGCHCSQYFAEKGYRVVIVDNLSRKGTRDNLAWLKEKWPITHYPVDIRNPEQLGDVFIQEKKFDAVLHLAAQVAVTTSVKDPREDFDINALGTFNMLECVRQTMPETPFLFSSTNKVYGNLPAVAVVEAGNRYTFKDIKGVSETQTLDFHSPYGCSKGCADQYVIDYARIYGMRTACFRQSCIYGERQFGVEDQGWVAWFIIAGVLGRPVTIYGDGKQVRDILFVEDLVKLYETAIEKGPRLRGEAYNIGGGQVNTLSLLELVEILKNEGVELNYTFDDWRPGDQKVFVSDNDKAQQTLGWNPKVDPENGIRQLIAWVTSHQDLLRRVLI